MAESQELPVFPEPRTHTMFSGLTPSASFPVSLLASLALSVAFSSSCLAKLLTVLADLLLARLSCRARSRFSCLRRPRVGLSLASSALANFSLARLSCWRVSLRLDTDLLAPPAAIAKWHRLARRLNALLSSDEMLHVEPIL